MFGRPADIQGSAHRLYAALVAQARRPLFYTEYAVPDSVDGRYDMIVVHAFLVMRRLGSEPQPEKESAAALSQALFDLFMADMDQNLREMGAGDLGVGRRVKAMAKAFYGRVAAYEEGFAGPDPVLEAALRRNLYGTVADLEQPSSAVLAWVAAYIRISAETLANVSIGDLRSGKLRFAEVDG